jgi:hypothetical protein
VSPVPMVCSSADRAAHRPIVSITVWACSNGKISFIDLTLLSSLNTRQILEWTNSPQPVLLVFLSLTGLPFLFDSKTPTSTRYSLQYATLIASSWALFLILPRPTFFFYYVLVIPYVLPPH